MAIRFRRSIRLAPGIRLNVGKRGVSVSAGVRGASVTAGAGGLYGNAGIPGTGLSARRKLSGGASQGGRPASCGKAASASSGGSNVTVYAEVHDDGVIRFTTGDGHPTPANYATEVKRQKTDELRELLATKAAEINEPVDALRNVHVTTPDPAHVIPIEPSPFEEARPEEPRPPQFSWLDKFIPSRKRRRLEHHSAEMQRYRAAFAAWTERKSRHDLSERELAEQFDQKRRTDTDTMAVLLEHQLKQIAWPRETLVSFDVLEDGRTVAIDVDLPEFEDMPSKSASFPQSGWRVSIKDMSDTQIRKLYAAHIQGIGFRLVGEVFASLPIVERVILSGYSQRIAKSTAQLENEYLYSANVLRSQWSTINFNRLALIDPSEAFSEFDLRRKMMKSGIFQVIEPFVVE